MKKYYLIILLALLTSFTNAQDRVIEEYLEGRRGITPMYSEYLFDVEELLHRNFDSAIMIQHSRGWDGLSDSNPDTICIWTFNRDGSNRAFIEYHNFGMNTTTREFDTVNKNMIITTEYRKGVKAGKKEIKHRSYLDSREVKIITETRGPDNVNTRIYFWDSPSGKDTASLKIITRNIDNKVIESKETVDSAYSSFIGGHIDYWGLQHHRTYQYDELGRVTRFSSFDRWGWDGILTIKYTDFGRVIERFDYRTGESISKDVELINRSDDGILVFTTTERQVTLVPLEKGSKLFKLKTVAMSGELPYIDYYEISYR